MESEAFKSIQYQRVSSEDDIVDEDLPPTIVSAKISDERGMYIGLTYPSR